MIALVVMTVAGGSLLLSATETSRPVDGAIAWHEQSPLRAVVQLLCLGYGVSTDYAGDIKSYLLGLGSGLAVLTLAVAVFARARTVDEEAVADRFTPEFPGAAAPPRRLHIAPLTAAQLLFGFYVLWSFASHRWSLAPDLSLGASLLLTVQLLWSFTLANSLSRRAARIATRLLIVIAAVSAAVAVWYYYGRNPNLRAKFPFGNPTFLAAAMVAAALLAVGGVCGGLGRLVHSPTARAGGALLGLVLALSLCLWALGLSESRGPALGLGFGLLAGAFFALRGRWRLMPIVLAVAVAIAGWAYFTRAAESTDAGRGQTLRFREYAWSYAWRMFAEQPVRGHGQGGFALTGDAYVANDVLKDPLVLQARVDHAHNEWLEVMADLGAVGIALLAAALLLTFRAGLGALHTLPTAGDRWALIGLMSALAAFLVSEASGVGLRTPDVPVWFYTVLGLTWAMSAGPAASGQFARLSASRNRRLASGVVGGVIGVASIALVQQDFDSARRGFEAGEAFRADDLDRTIELAGAALDRLNPQRALLDLFRLSEAHLRAAEVLQARAIDRERRASETDPLNPRLLALAKEDYDLSDEHCDEGSRWLKELLLRSPGYIHHGVLDYRLNATRAGNPDARGDAAKQTLLLKTAAEAVKREIRRQPFDPAIAADYVRAIIGSGEWKDDARGLIDVLARPLRHNRVAGSYIDLLNTLSGNETFRSAFDASVQRAADVLAARPAPPGVVQAEFWAPEKLRLAATVRFLSGDFAAARDYLETAAKAYEALAAPAPMGAAGCHAELADCRFFAGPDDPQGAVQAATRAISLAPKSLEGRQLERSVETRMVDYYLAGSDEEKAKAILRRTGPAGVAEAAVEREMGTRYARLVESVVDRADVGAASGEIRPEIFPRVKQWTARAVELNPDDTLARFQAADFAIRDGDGGGAVDHLRRAVALGLPPEVARRLLKDAVEQLPDSDALRALDSELAAAAREDAADGESTGQEPPAP